MVLACYRLSVLGVEAAIAIILDKAMLLEDILKNVEEVSGIWAVKRKPSPRTTPVCLKKISCVKVKKWTEEGGLYNSERLRNLLDGLHLI